MDRSWIRRRRNKDGSITDEFKQGVIQFLNFAFSKEDKVFDGVFIPCPCKTCKNQKFQNYDEVTYHLYNWGFIEDYTLWYAHGETFSRTRTVGVGESTSDANNLQCNYNQMIIDGLGAEFNLQTKCTNDNVINPYDEEPNAESGGTTLSVVHQHNIEKEKGNPTTHLEVFSRTHRTNGGKGDFVDKKSKKKCETYHTSLVEKYSDMTQAPNFDSSSWTNTIGSITKDRVYGFGTTRPSDVLGDAYGGHSAWSRATHHRDIRSSSISQSTEAINQLIEERIQIGIQDQMEQFKKQMEDSHRTQLERFEQMLNERMTNIPQPQTTSSSSLPSSGYWYPNHGMFNAPSHGPFGGQCLYGGHSPYYGQCPYGGQGSFGRHDTFGGPSHGGSSSGSGENQDV